MQSHESHVIKVCLNNNHFTFHTNFRRYSPFLYYGLLVLTSHLTVMEKEHSIAQVPLVNNEISR